MSAQALLVTSVHHLHHKAVLKGFGAGCLLLLFSLISVFADTHFVSLSGGNVWPYTNWVTAATIFQDAMDAANVGDTVLVTNGVYAAGGAFAADLSNRVAITKAVTVRSMNGPEVTFIQGQGPMGYAAVRCAYVADGAKLIGFTLTKGFTHVSSGSSSSGGGLYCDSAATTISNCTFIGNSSYCGGGTYRGTLYNCILTGNGAISQWSRGGGAYESTLYHCILTGNSAHDGGGATGGRLYNCTLTSNSVVTYGGGAYASTLYNCILIDNLASSLGGGASDSMLYNCTLTGNSAYNGGGGTHGGELYNCIAYYNMAPQNPNYSGSMLNYCCTLPAPSSGIGNFTNAPGLTGLTNPHLTQDSPCIDSGNNAYVFNFADLDGEARTNGTTVDVGCDEFWVDSCTGTLRVAILTLAGTNAMTGYPLSFQADIGGRPLTYIWRFGDGVSTTNEIVVSHAYESSGKYSVVLEAANLSGNVSATVTVQIVSMAEATRYVTANGNDAANGMSWATAKATIQGGIAAATTPNGLVLVSNGVYSTGGAFAAGMMNRIVIANGLTVQSVNGPEVTIIQGQEPMGAAAIRCAYVADGAKLVGFTLTNGFTQTSSESSGSGGGIYCDSAAGIVSNCTLTGNGAYYYGGSAYNGTLYNCTLTGNSAHNGGGAYGGTLYNCTLIKNSASYGGGAYNDTLHNCTLTGNSASFIGGGAFAGTLYHCTLTGNSARDGGGGASGGKLYNCIAYYNTASQNPNCSGGALNYCCTLPTPSFGTGNFTNAPGLVGLTNPHLTQGSPCIDSGNNAYVFTATDLDGEARTNGTTVDVGCDEFWANSCTGTLQVAILTPVGTNALTGETLSFQTDISGCPLTYIWRFGDGVSTTNEIVVSHAYESSGKYSVVLEAANLSGNVSATVTVQIVSMVGATRYVAVHGNDAADGMSWATAKATIQGGIAAATTPNGLVLVSNGVYSTGGAFAAGLMNRIVIANGLTVQSVNGPEVTIIQGQGPMGAAAIRCAYVADGAKLVGFTLTNGFTQTSSGSSGSGGGIYCDSAAGIVSNCTLTGNSASSGGGAYNGTLYNCMLIGNSAFYGGGGAYLGVLSNSTLTGNSASYGGGASASTLYNCTFTGNSAFYGGGAYDGTFYNCMLTDNSAYNVGGGVSYGTLYNCTLTGNSASSGGGMYGGTLYNCIVYYNDAVRGANYYDSTFNYSCTTPHPGGSGNITSEPELASFSHLAVGSPCRGAGHSDYATGIDMDGEAWLVPPSMGCDEVVVGAITGELSVSAWAVPTNMAVDFPIRFRADILGRTTRSVWDFGDGSVLSNKPYALHAYASPGVYAVLLRAYNESDSAGITATVTVHVAAQVIHYVKLDNATPIAPYTSWATAATNIQDAINAASQVGALVLVSNGVYTTGGRVVYGALSNRVAMIKPVTVRSVNGPARTIIQGAGPVGDSAVRCAYVGTNAVLEGFTLTHGATRSSGDVNRERCGGGVMCESSGVLSNCVLTGNSASSDGGGVYGGTLYNCTLTDNSASSGGGGVYGGMLYNCLLTGNSASSYGGGAYGSMLYHCAISGNSVSNFGGGIYDGTLYNCTLLWNSARYGGGVYGGTLYNCTLTGNSASFDGGGACWGTLYNCTLTGNSAFSYGGGAYGSTLYYCAISGNSVSNFGGGIYDGTLYNCTLLWNSARYGGGASRGTLYNCTMTGNLAFNFGGGAYDGRLYNCIVYYNAAPNDSNYLGSTLNYSCTTPEPGGTANITNDPQFVNASAGDYHLQSTSPCINTGINQDWIIGATDMDGNPRLDASGRVDMGVYEYHGMSIWSNTTAPIVVGSGPDSAVELGVKFKSDVAGNITGIRFYKADANTGIHTGNLWTTNGVRLATVNFSNETDSGWQQALFATPVVIVPHTIYIASYHANNGHYSCDVNYFSGKGTDNPPLHALADGVAGGNGVYHYGAGSLFPNQTWNAANYWVDVVFQTESRPILTSIAVIPTNSTISTGASRRFTAMGTYSDGSAQDITSQTTWTSSDTDVATIDARGLATAISVGAVTLSAMLSGVVGFATLTVNAPLIITTTSLSNGAMNVAYTGTLTAVDGTSPYFWSIFNGSLPSGLTLNSGSGLISGTPTTSGIFRFTAQARDSGSPAQKVIQSLSISIVMNIWSNTTVPTVVDVGADNPVELGVKFRSDVTGTIAGIRFYKSDANTDIHVGNLWTSNGTLLATIPFTNETASGWQQALFDAPVAIASDTVYVASYHANNGHYSADVNYFQEKGVDHPPLHAPANNVSDGNGVYAYGASSAFPHQTWNAANYWVDVVFLPGSPPPPLTSMTLMAADASSCEASASPAGGNVERWPSVWTSGDLSEEYGATNLIDGDTNTIWIGNVGGEPWRVILDLGVVTDVTGIQLMFPDTVWTNKEIIGSRDSEVWFDHLAETNEWVPLRYLYVNFWGDERGAQPPAIREIIWRDR